MPNWEDFARGVAFASFIVTAGPPAACVYHTGPGSSINQNMQVGKVS